MIPPILALALEYEQAVSTWAGLARYIVWVCDIGSGFSLQ